jgi:hypothetical protein
MSNETNPNSPSPGVPPAKTNWGPIRLTILSAFLLAAGSCFGAISSRGNTAPVIFSVLFIVCVLAFFGGLIWALVARIKSS